MSNDPKLKEIGINQYRLISPAELDFRNDIRKICEKNTCHKYGKSWACPPAVGTVEQCKERCMQYENAMVFNAVYPLKASFDYPGMFAALKEFKRLCDRLNELAKSQFDSFLILSGGNCARCKKCTYPSEPCRMPDKLYPALEGFGINVSELAEKVGLLYNNGKNTVTFFGMLLYNKI